MVRRRANLGVERAGVNAVVALLEAAGHIVHQVDGTKDHGLDLYVQLVGDGRPTGAHIAVQVKSGSTYRRSFGYAIPVGKHAEIWRTTNVPVIGVVYDPEMRMLYWCNVTGHLQETPDSRAVPVGEDQVLTRQNVAAMIAEVRGFIHPVDPTRRVIARLVRARHGPGEPSVVGGMPNKAFSFIAKWVERNHGSVGKAAIFAALAAIVMSGALTLALVHLFAVRHVSITNTWTWTAVVAAFATLALGAAYFEQIAGRSAVLLRCLGGVPLMVYCVLSQVELSPRAARVISTLGAELAGKGMLILALFFVIRELDRRRRMRAAYGAPTAEHRGAR
ncbi:DUF4365 domain-containing protein [Mycolicibacterium wolinskyi]|uniref:DUF4365 domain-containing protein n=1 Tax=Mycolicibacterium wolinskyi TaxID=59750 RepID=A0A1X2EWH9_9MYCO|nr:MULTISPECIES: DUF4365 domain-containing protein [Mycolicibacterium]MCV7286264.1 DUF4365 domain-containing protein [Mycolicibacterium wolinskyi]MCV7293244.1 DUF4365 domain-containing protein [Mycolicibacterium goodii]ORX10517.1 hypothetical protein AWC31_04245 [Mycolicibacterium wolinskyi]